MTDKRELSREVQKATATHLARGDDLLKVNTKLEKSIQINQHFENYTKNRHH